MSEFLCSDQEGSYFFFMEETGLLKTDFGECNLNVTHPSGGECFKILVSLIPDPKGNL